MINQWHTDYYHPISLKLYDWAVEDMLRLMEVEPDATVLAGGCGPGMHSIRIAKSGYPGVGSIQRRPNGCSTPWSRRTELNSAVTAS